MIAVIKLTCLGFFLIATVFGELAGNADSSSTVKQKEQHAIIKEYFREEFDDEGK